MRVRQRYAGASGSSITPRGGGGCPEERGGHPHLQEEKSSYVMRAIYAPRPCLIRVCVCVCGASACVCVRICVLLPRVSAAWEVPGVCPWMSRRE